MVWLVRPLATASVLLGIVVALRTATPVDAEPGPSLPAEGIVALSPQDWPRAAVDHLAARGAPLSREEMDEIVLAVGAVARRFAMDPLLVLAVMEVESRFDPYAVSAQGAIGLMQVRPETARDLAVELGVDWTSDDLLYDRGLNVTLGAYYLRSLLDRFGDLDAALAAYHAGPGRIEARLARDERPALDYAERVWDAVFALQARVHV